MAQSSRVRPMPKVHTLPRPTPTGTAHTPTAMRKSRWCVYLQPRHSNSVSRWQWRGRSVQTSLTLPGTIALNADRRVHVVSRIPGIVQEIRKQLGDAVRAGEVMAVIDSRELADTKAAYLAARERVTLAETTFAREKDLWEKKISRKRTISRPDRRWPRPASSSRWRPEAARPGLC